jgi:hypothetical protein
MRFHTTNFDASLLVSSNDEIDLDKSAPIAHVRFGNGDKSSPLDGVANDLDIMVQEILTFHDAMDRDQIRERWKKNLDIANRFVGKTVASSFAYEDDDNDAECNIRGISFANDSLPPWPQPLGIPEPGPQLAVYHALRNDFLAGGDVEQVVQLETKSAPVPFAELNTLLDDIETQPECVDTVTDDVAIPVDNEQWNSLDIPPLDLAITSPVAGAAIETHLTRPLPFENYDDIAIGSTAKPSLALDAWFRDDLMQTPEVAVADSNVPKKGLSLLELQSDLRTKSMNLMEQTSRMQVSKSELARRDAMLQALVLLRTLQESDWKAFDHPVDETELMDEPDDTAQGESGEPSASIVTAGEPRLVGVGDEDTDAYVAGAVDAMTGLVALAQRGTVLLTTPDFNFILARMAIATDVLPDDILIKMMSIYHQMADLAEAGFDCAPNAFTYEILLLALTRRFCAFQPALDLVVSLLDSPTFSWTPKTLEATLQLCERKGLFALTQKILSQLQSSSGSDVEIPKRAYQSLINLMKSNDARNGALEVLRLLLKVRSVSSRMDVRCVV